MQEMALDHKDLAIIGALNKVGAKASAEYLGEVLGIPSRTVRYRLSRLRKKGFLYPPRAMTHERKLGLGESSVCMKATRLGIVYLPRILDALPSFYWITESYGTYDGYMAHCVYPLESPESIPSLMIALKDEGLVQDYHVFDVVDYEHKQPNYEYLTTDISWEWDWSQWYTSVKRNLQRKSGFTIQMNEHPQLVEFDSKDIALLRHLGKNGESTQRHLAETLSLSEKRANKRLQRLESTGIIKGYRSAFIPTINQFSLSLFLELEEPVEPILSSFYELPLPLYVMMESRTRFCIQLGFSASDYTGFLNGFDILRPFIVSYFFQTLHNPRRTKSGHPLDLFNDESGSWEFPEDSINIIREHLESG
jgi:DNA-binding Lrp family transcriptional regulator